MDSGIRTSSTISGMVVIDFELGFHRSGLVFFIKGHGISMGFFFTR